MFKKYATWNKVEYQLEKFARRIDNLESNSRQAHMNYTFDIMINLLTEAGILTEVKEENPKNKVVYNNKTYKIKKVK